MSTDEGNQFVDDVNRLSGAISHTLKKFVEGAGEAPVLSSRTITELEKRLSAKGAQTYSDPNRLPELIGFEIGEIGNRIYQFRYIVRYRQYFQTNDRDMGTAFAKHTHSLRGSEIYIILEKSCNCLQLLYYFAEDLKLKPRKRWSKLKERFNSEFERHLRERHRTVHGHERPSLTSLHLSLWDHYNQLPADELPVGEMLRGILELVPKDYFSEKPNLSPKEIMNHCVEIQQKDADETMLKMWAIFVEELAKVIDQTASE